MLRGYTVQAALDAPRFCISPGTPDATVEVSGAAGDINGEVYFEEGISTETVSKLRGEIRREYRVYPPAHRVTEMGHDAREVSGFDRSMMGRGQIIQKLKNASGALVWAAGSDPRGDGHAAPQI